jgi:tetratricopeptide (TPR) repeat protein
MNFSKIAQWNNGKSVSNKETYKIIITALISFLLYSLLLFTIPQLSYLPLLAVTLSWIWFSLPGFLLSFVVIKHLSWVERIPISFGLSVGIYTPITVFAILFQLDLSLLITMCVGANLLITVAYLIFGLKNKAQQVDAADEEKVVALDKPVSWDLILLLFIVLCSGLLAYLSLQWPPAGDDISGLPIFAEVLRLDYVTAAEPFHGSGTPSTPRNELIVWTYQNILNNRIAGVTPVEYFVNTRPILIILAFLGLFTLLHQYFRKFRIALVLLSFWSIYLLATIKVEGLGSNLITRIFQDKFMGWFVVVPTLLVLLLWYLQGKKWNYLVGFGIAAIGATLIHPITMTQFMIIGGGFCILYFLLNPSWSTAKKLGWLGAIVAFCLFILVIQYLRYRGYAPVVEAGYGPAVEFGRLRMAVSRYRLWLLEGDRYILHPSVALQPVIILGYLLLPALFLKIRKNLGTQLILSSLIIFPSILFIPFLARFVGSFVTPYLLWRLAWPLETFAVLSIGWAVWVLIEFLESQFGRIIPNISRQLSYVMSMVLVLIGLGISRAEIQAGFVNLGERFDEVEHSLCLNTVDALEFLDEMSHDQEINVLASKNLNFCVPGFVPRANVVEYRGLGTVNRLPLKDISASLQRVEDAHYFSNAVRVDDQIFEIIKRYNIDFILLEKDRFALDLQLKYLPGSFIEEYSDDQVILFSVADPLPDHEIIQANSALQARNWEDAQKRFEKILRADPNQPLAYYGLGEAFEGQGQIDLALEQYLHASKLGKNEAALHAKVAGTYLLLNEVESASEQYLQALAIEPNIASLYSSLARAYLLGDDQDLALRFFEKAAEFKVSNNTAAYYTVLAKQLADVGWFSKAIESYQHALELEPDPLRYVALGKVYNQLGKDSEAIEQFNQAKKIDPWLFTTHLQLGGIYSQQGNHDAAIKEYETAWQLNPTYNSPYILLGQEIQEEYGTQAAIQRLQSLVSLNEGIPGPHRGLAPLYVADGQREAALAELDLCSQIQPQDASIQVAIGYLLLANGETNLAQQAYENALLDNPDLISVRLGLSSLYALDAESGPEIGQLYQIIRNEPTLFWPHLSLASAYQKLGLLDDMEREINWAIELAPENPEGYIFLGKFYQARADWDLAKSSFQQALELDPDNTDSMVQLAQIHQSDGDLETARGLLEQAVQINENDAYAMVKLSEVYWSMGLFDQSNAVREQAVNVDPESGYALMLLANSYYQQGRIEDANYLYQRAIQVEPSLIAAYAAGAQLETEMENNWDAAGALFSTAIETNPSSSLAHLLAGKYFQQRGNYQEAELAFQTALLLPTISVENFLTLSDLYFLVGAKESALEILDKAADAFPSEAKVFNSYAEIYLNLGQIEDAQASFEYAIKLDSTYIPPYTGLSRIFEYHGEPGKAEEILVSALSTNPRSSEAMLALAKFYENQENYPAAESYYQAAIENAPAELNTYLSSGQYYQRRKLYEKSLEVFSSASSIPSHTPELNLNIAISLQALHRSNEAIRSLEEAIQFDRSDPRAYLELADIYASLGEWDRVSSSLNEALAIQPNEFQVNMAAGDYYQSLGMISKAVDHYQRAINYDRRRTEPLIALSDLYSVKRDWSQAFAVLEQAISSNPTDAEAYGALGKTYQLINLDHIAEAVLSEGIENSFDRARAYSLRAGFYLDNGMWDQAQYDLEKAWQINPNSQAMGMQFALHLINRGDVDAALNVLDQLSSLPNASPQVLIAKGLIHSQNANWSAATQAFHDAIQMGGDNQEAYAGFARIHMIQGNQIDAIKLYQIATEVAPNDPQAWVNLGDAYQELLDYSQASESYSKALQLDFKNMDALIQLDNISRNVVEAGISPPDLQKIINSVPSVELSQSLGSLYQSRGDWKNAEYWYKKALSLDPYDGSSWLSIANFYSALELWEQSYTALTDGIKYQPASASLHTALGHVQEKMNLEEDALQSYQLAIDLAPNQFEGYESLANLQLNTGLGQEGVNTLKKWLDYAPGDYHGYASLGKLYAEQGQTDLAVETYQAGLKTLPGAADFYVNIGNVYGARILQLTENLASAEAYERSVRYRIDDIQDNFSQELNRRQQRASELKLLDMLALYRKVQSQLEFAQIQYSGLESDVSAAQFAYSNALEIQPYNEAALLSLGRINLVLGNTEQAMEYFEQSLEINPNSSIALNFLGNAYLEENNPEAAAGIFEKLLVYDPTNSFGHIGLFTAYNAYEQPSLVHASEIIKHGQFTWDNLINYLRYIESN